MGNLRTTMVTFTYFIWDAFPAFRRYSLWRYFYYLIKTSDSSVLQDEFPYPSPAEIAAVSRGSAGMFYLKASPRNHIVDLK